MMTTTLNTAPSSNYHLNGAQQVPQVMKKQSSSSESAGGEGDNMFPLGSLLLMNTTTQTVTPEQTASSSSSMMMPSSYHQCINNSSFSSFDDSSMNMLDRLSVLQGILSSSNATGPPPDLTPYPAGEQQHQSQQQQQNFNNESSSTSLLLNNESFVIDIDDLLEVDNDEDVLFNKETAFDLDIEVEDEKDVEEPPTPVLSTSSAAFMMMEPTPFSSPTTSSTMMLSPSPVDVTSSSPSCSSSSNNTNKNKKKRELQERQEQRPSTKKQRLNMSVVEVPKFENPIPTRFREYQADQWTEKFEELCTFIKLYGHCQVPRDYQSPGSSDGGGNSQLSRWLKRQRYQYKLKQECKPSTMTNDRIKALEALPGFVWNSHIATWEERYMELVTFKNLKGHCNVPSIYSENQKLATWVKCQRRQAKLYHSPKHHDRSNMTVERMDRLNSIGFVWELRCMSNNSNSNNN